MTKVSMLLLATGLFLASCGNSESTEETTATDTMTTAPMAEEASPMTADSATMMTDTAATTTPTP